MSQFTLLLRLNFKEIILYYLHNPSYNIIYIDIKMYLLKYKLEEDV